jgi:hypothetical protein
MPMFIDPSNIISAEKLEKRRHKITLLVTTRPEQREDWLPFFNKVAKRFCADYKCKFIGNLDVSLNPMNDGSILVFTVKEYKHPERHDVGLQRYHNLR